jgi:hypothetical protein
LSGIVLWRESKKTSKEKIVVRGCMPKKMEEDGPLIGRPFAITKALLLKNVSLVVGREDAPSAYKCARFDLALSS